VSDLGVIFAGGGTGGHIYPGLAIAERLLARADGTEVRFLCSQRPIDTQILRQAGVAFEPIPARELILRPHALLRLARDWGPSVRAARQAIRSMTRRANRVVVVALGGFVSAPVAHAARAEGAPVILVNLDAAPGKANRFVARRADATFTAAASPEAEARGWTRTPPIVRSGAVGGDDPADCRLRLGLRPDVPTLLITGASQGARSVNEAVVAFAERHAEALEGWQIFHQTGGGTDTRGAPTSQRVAEAYKRLGLHGRVVAFCEDMGAAWGAADVAISRAGAGSVGEAWANATPTIFLPYPHHRDEHQRRNAEPLVNAGGALLVQDTLEASQTAEALAEALLPLLAHHRQQARMRASLRSLGPADGAERIAEAILGRV